MTGDDSKEAALPPATNVEFGEDWQNWEMDEYRLIERLGAPSMEGVVWRAKHRKILDRAVKFVSPSFKRAVLEREIRLLSALRHSHIVAITDYGKGRPTPPRDDPKGQQASLIGEDIVYFAMDYVPGNTFGEAFASLRVSAFFDVIDQVLDAVGYLHSVGVLHMDLKPANILIEEGFNNAVLIDLGFSVVARPDLFLGRFGEREDAAQLIGDRLFVGTTREYTRKDRWTAIQAGQGYLERERLAEDFFPGHDLLALGRILKEGVEGLLGPTQPDRAELEPLLDVALRLEAGEYQDASQAREDLRKLDPRQRAPLGVQELSTVLAGGTFVAQSIETVALSARFRRLLDHPLVQRLRQISQLDFEYLLYPDARSSRLAHSLRTYHVCREALGYLLGDVNFRLAASRAEIEATLLMAFLHDIGHYPLSHMFEDLRGKITDEVIKSDDDLFLSSIRGELPLSRTIRGSLGPPILEEIQASFGDETVQALLAIAAHLSEESKVEGAAIHRALAGLLSSDIDVDKISYLLGDSFASGVPYGKGVDLHGLFSSLRLPPNSSDDVVLALNSKGLAGAESVVLARYWMLSRVYWHHSNRAMMAAHKFIIEDALSKSQLTFEAYYESTFWKTEIGAARQIAQTFDDLYRKSKTPIRNPLRGLLDGRRELYKRLLVVSPTRDDSLARKLEGASEWNSAELARKAINEELGVQWPVGAVIVDVPRKGRDELHLKRIVVLDDFDDDAPSRSLDEASPLLREAKAEFLNEVKKSRVFLAPELFASLDEGALRRARKAADAAIRAGNF